MGNPSRLWGAGCPGVTRAGAWALGWGVPRQGDGGRPWTGWLVPLISILGARWACKGQSLPMAEPQKHGEDRTWLINSPCGGTGLHKG